MLRFDDLQLFVRAADLGSLSAAARVMDMSAAVASAALKRIEQQLGARLLARSTRSLRLTAEGEGFLEYARAALSNLDEGRRLLASGQDQVSGILQLSAPSDFGRNLLLPWLDAFQREHPKLTVRLLLGDRIADLFRQPVDIALRYGEPEDSSLIALPIAPHNRRVLCASPITWPGRASRAISSNWPSTIACSTCSAAAFTTTGVFTMASAKSA